MRKELASIAFAFILSTGTPARAQDIPSPTSTEVQDEALRLQSQLAQVYDIEIVNNITRWDSDRLVMLDRFLTFLPPNLYSQTEDGRKTRLELTPSIDSAAAATCACTAIAGDGEADIIELTTFSFNPASPERAFQTIAHELIHRRMPTIALTDEPSFGNPQSYTSPWYETIDTILGADFSVARHDLYRDIVPKWRSIMESFDGEEKTDFMRFMNIVTYGLGKNPSARQRQEYFDHPIEFVAVLGQHFVAGKNYFFRMYGLIFNEEITDGLYSFTRDEIFDGREYENYSPLVKPLTVDESLIPDFDAPLLIAVRTKRLLTSFEE